MCCFSSRRRHTILVSDWSSDVCSSDLGWGFLVFGQRRLGATERRFDRNPQPLRLFTHEGVRAFQVMRHVMLIWPGNLLSHEALCKQVIALVLSLDPKRRRGDAARRCDEIDGLDVGLGEVQRVV